MGNTGGKHPYTLSDATLKKVKKETGFSTAQVRRLFHRFQYLDKDGKGHLLREDLGTIHEVGKRLKILLTLFNSCKRTLNFALFCSFLRYSVKLKLVMKILLKR